MSGSKTLGNGRQLVCDSFDASGQRLHTLVETPGVSRTITTYPFSQYEVEQQFTWQYNCTGGCSWKWVLTNSITRRTYFLGGQAIATRITGDPVSGNNGLFYFLTDHTSAGSVQVLGSTSMLISTLGAVVAGTAAYYQPYGSYRTSPPNTLTERGYTGHHASAGSAQANRDIGLTYMNARFYSPTHGQNEHCTDALPPPSNSYLRYSEGLEWWRTMLTQRRYYVEGYGLFDIGHIERGFLAGLDILGQVREAVANGGGYVIYTSAGSYGFDDYERVYWVSGNLTGGRDNRCCISYLYGF